MEAQMNVQLCRMIWLRWYVRAAIVVACVVLAPCVSRAEPLADSFEDWSVDGIQGQNNWFYGFYDVRDDFIEEDGIYEPDDFIPFLNDGSEIVSRDQDIGAWKVSANDWDGDKWDLLNNDVVAHGPWTEVTRTGGHPAANAQGDNSVHWNIRRWESDVDGDVTLFGSFSNDSAIGDGTLGRIFVDGREVWASVTHGNVVHFGRRVPVRQGSTIDFVTDPDGSRIYGPVTGIHIDEISDDGDGTQLTVQITNGLLPGDANMDTIFDQRDLVAVQIAAKYLTGRPATWGEGDWNGAPGGKPGNPPPGDGLFNSLDIVAALTFGVYSTGPFAFQASVFDSEERTSIVYDGNTGELSVNAPVHTELTSIHIDSTLGIFTGSAAQILGGSFDNDVDDNNFEAIFGSSFGSLSFGNVAQPGLTEISLLDDLTVTGSLAGGGDLGDVDLIYVPEASTVMLLVAGSWAVAAFRRRVPNVR
jgi:hypothetical protein